MTQGTVHNLCREWGGVLRSWEVGQRHPVWFTFVFFHGVFVLPRTVPSSSQKLHVEFKDGTKYCLKPEIYLLIETALSALFLVNMEW